MAAKAYSVVYTEPALKALRRIPSNVAKNICRKVLALAQDPYGRHNNASKLRDREGYRLRVGDWRVFYTIHNDRLVVRVIDVKPRGSAYA